MASVPTLLPAAVCEKLAEDAALTALMVVEVSEVVLGAARGCQFPLNLTNLACDIVESTLDDAPHDRAVVLNGGRCAGVAGDTAGGQK